MRTDALLEECAHLGIVRKMTRLALGIGQFAINLDSEHTATTADQFDLGID